MKGAADLSDPSRVRIALRPNQSQNAAAWGSQHRPFAKLFRSRSLTPAAGPLLANGFTLTQGRSPVSQNRAAAPFCAQLLGLTGDSPPTSRSGKHNAGLFVRRECRGMSCTATRQRCSSWRLTLRRLAHTTGIHYRTGVLLEPLAQFGHLPLIDNKLLVIVRHEIGEDRLITRGRREICAW
jgi:hypothetical protein